MMEPRSLILNLILFLAWLAAIEKDRTELIIVGSLYLCMTLFHGVKVLDKIFKTEK